jgi:hypothetical protein
MFREIYRSDHADRQMTALLLLVEEMADTGAILRVVRK